MKTKGNWIAFGVCAIGVITGAGILRATGPEPVIGASVFGEDPSEWAIRQKDEAISKAREILGIPQPDDIPAEAKVVVLAEDNTPFLSGELIGRAVWQVVIREWKLLLKSAPPDEQDSYVRTFDVFLRCDDGRLLKIVSRWPQGVPPIPPEPGPASYTRQMRGSGNEKYHGFPTEAPPIKFLDALDTVLRDGGNALGAEQIVGQYVVWSRMGRDPIPVWAITLRDTQPFWEAAYPGVSVNARNHMRHIVDAQTGKWVCAGSTPQPTTLDGKPTKPE